MAGVGQRVLSSGTEHLTFVEAIRALYSEAGAGKWAKRTDCQSPQALGLTVGNGGMMELSWVPNNGRRIFVVISGPDTFAGEWALVDPQVFMKELHDMLEAMQ